MALDNIERATGLVRDVPERDDIYEFYSAFVVAQIRRKFGHWEDDADSAKPAAAADAAAGDAGDGPDRSEDQGPAAGPPIVPQIVREYHGRLGAALEATLAASSNKLFEVANHYHVAGARYAAKAVEYCSSSAQPMRRPRAAISLRPIATCGWPSTAAQWTERIGAVETEKHYLRCCKPASRPRVTSEARGRRSPEIPR